MMRREIWSRLGLLCALLALVGCEQSSYSSSSAAPDAVANAPVEAPTLARPNDQASVADSVASSQDEPPQPVAAAASDSTGTANSVDTPKPAASEAKGTKELTFDDIKFDIEKDGMFERSMLTSEIEALVGRTVRIRGYILPTFQQTGIRNFVLVRDNMECCFGPGAALYDCIVVDMIAGQSTDFTTRPVAVEGTFSIRELLDFDGVVRAIYHIEGKAVK